MVLTGGTAANHVRSRIGKMVTRLFVVMLSRSMDAPLPEIAPYRCLVRLIAMKMTVDGFARGAPASMLLIWEFLREPDLVIVAYSDSDNGRCVEMNVSLNSGRRH